MKEIVALQKELAKVISKTTYGKQPQSLYTPIHYLMELGGKRVRPMLTLLAYSLYKKDVKSITKYAIAVEAFHNFSLMHDDIMDNAPLRRGKPTVHEKWNVNTAILSGDVMLVKVYEIFQTLPADILKEVLIAFNKTAAGVCEGQQWDMEFETEKHVSEKQYLHMIEQKTAVLLGFSLELGGILAGAPKKECKALYEFGTNIGIGFQLMDDLLDAYGDPKKFGKQIGGDIIANKKTFLLINALAHATPRQKRLLKQWLSATKFNKKEKVEAVKHLYDEIDVASLTEKKVNYYFSKGFKQLGKLNVDPKQKEILHYYASQLIERQS
jgi:geranylgeranyl diphosphate synthase type II